MPDVVSHPADHVFGASILAAETIAQELRERLARELARRRPTHLASELLDIARAILSEFEPLLAESLLNADLAAWLVGSERVADKLTNAALESLARDLRRLSTIHPRLLLTLSKKS